MNNWYNRVVIASKEVEYVDDGIVYTAEISGSHRPATYEDPAEFPEVEITDADIDDVGELWNYVDRIDNQFMPVLEKALQQRRQYFGDIDEPIIIDLNGIRYNVGPETWQGSTWEILGAEMIDADLFLRTLPEDVNDRISEYIYEKYVGEGDGDGSFEHPFEE